MPFPELEEVLDNYKACFVEHHMQNMEVYLNGRVNILWINLNININITILNYKLLLALPILYLFYLRHISNRLIIRQRDTLKPNLQSILFVFVCSGVLIYCC